MFALCGRFPSGPSGTVSNTLKTCECYYAKYISTVRRPPRGLDSPFRLQLSKLAPFFASRLANCKRTADEQ